MTRAVRLVHAGGAFAADKVELSIPETLGHEQVLVEVEAATVGFPELARATCAESSPGGISAVGIASRAGAGAEHLLGKRVACGPDIPCGDCRRCRRGHPELCESRQRVGGDAFASHVIAGARWLCPLAPPIEVAGPEAALLAREATAAYTLYARANLAPGARALVLGRGVVARLCVQILAAQGIRAAVAASDAEWGKCAADAGAEVLQLDGEPDAKVLRERISATAGEEASAEVDAVFETSGEPTSRALALALASPGATAILAGRGITGAPMERRQTSVDEAADAGATIIGVAGPHPDLLPEAAALAARGELDLASAAEVRPIEDVGALADALSRGELPGRSGVVLIREPRERGPADRP